jgi:ribosome-associated protein
MKKTSRPKSSKGSTPRKPTRGKKAPSRRPAPKKRPVHKAPAPAPVRPASPSPKAREEDARAKALAQTMAQLVLDKKASDVVILDVRGKTSYADYVVVASGDSERQVVAMAEHIQEKQREAGRRPLGTEGMETGQWVLLDYGEVVAHLFFQEVRAFYDLEGLWADAPREKVA